VRDENSDHVANDDERHGAVPEDIRADNSQVTLYFAVEEIPAEPERVGREG
jgi:hypothetical protein